MKEETGGEAQTQRAGGAWAIAKELRLPLFAMRGT